VWASFDSKQHNELPSWKPPIPTVHVVDIIFGSGKAAMITASKSRSFSGRKRKRFDCNEDYKDCGTKREPDHCDKNYDLGKTQKIPPCGLCINWNEDEGIEVLVGARGIKHGKKPKNPEDIEKLASRLCRAKLAQKFRCMCEGTTNTIETEIPLCVLPKLSRNEARCSPFYSQMKEHIAKSDWSKLKTKVLTQNGSPLAGWIRDA